MTYKTRKISRKTPLGKVLSYAPLSLTSVFLASWLAGTPLAGKNTLPAAAGMLVMHELDPYEIHRNPRFGRAANTTTDALLMETALATVGILALQGRLQSLDTLQNIPGFAPPSFDQAHGGQA